MIIKDSMKNFIYHRVYRKHIDDVLQDGFLKAKITHPKGENSLPCVCFTRNYDYMKKERPFVIIFDRDVLLQHFKIVPVCVRGLIEQSNNPLYNIEHWKRIIPNYGLECEERIYGYDIDLKYAEYIGYIN